MAFEIRLMRTFTKKMAKKFMSKAPRSASWLVSLEVIVERLQKSRASSLWRVAPLFGSIYMVMQNKRLAKLVSMQPLDLT
jgi:hypothetical protein